MKQPSSCVRSTIHWDMDKGMSFTLGALVLAICALSLLLATQLSGNPAKAAAPEVAVITVQRGDTLWNIAKKYGDPGQYILKNITLICRMNGFDRGHMLCEGDIVRVPAAHPRKPREIE